MTSDPKRLRAGAGDSDELRRLLDAAHDDVLDEASVARVRAQLGVAGVAASAAVTIAATGAKASHGLTSLLGAKLAALALVATAATGAFVLLRRPVAEPVSSSAPVTVSVPASAAVSEPVPAAAAASAAVTASVAVTDLPVAPRHHAAAQRTQPRPPPPPEPAATTPREGSLLLQARSVLATDPARALGLVRQHEAEFPSSQLAPERDKLRREAEKKMSAAE